MNKIIVSMIVVMVITITVVAPTANAFYIGQTGDEVAELQATLIESGFDIPAITSGAAKLGYFGLQTKKALDASEATKGIKLGATPGPDIYSPYLNLNGFKLWPYYSKFTTGTASTTCSFRSPNATTTVLKAGYQLNRVGSTTQLQIGLSANVMATTTLLHNVVNAFTTDTSPIAVTASSSASIIPIPPNYYINYKLGNFAGFTTNATGSCSLLLTEF